MSDSPPSAQPEVHFRRIPEGLVCDTPLRRGGRRSVVVRQNSRIPDNRYFRINEFRTLVTNFPLDLLQICLVLLKAEYGSGQARIHIGHVLGDEDVQFPIPSVLRLNSL